jgi:hypothetical protein
MAEQADPIDGIEQELDADAPSVAPPDLDGKPEDTPEESEREDDEFSGEDKEQRMVLYSIFIPNEGVSPTLEDKKTPNPKYRKLNLDRDGQLGYHDLLRCAVLERRRHRVCEVPYKVRDKVVPKDEPWKRWLGFSFNNKTPSINEDGECLQYCKHFEAGVPFAMCSKKTTFEDGEALIEPLEKCKATLVSTDGKQKIKASGECPNGRWKNTLDEEVKELFKIKPGDNDAPLCNNQVVFYSWALDLAIPFRVIFKSTAVKSADRFLAECSVGYGSTLRKLDFWKFVGHLDVFDGGNFVRPNITNTKDRTVTEEIEPVVEWWKSVARPVLVRDLVDVATSQRKKKERDDKKGDDTPF